MLLPLPEHPSVDIDIGLVNKSIQTSFKVSSGRVVGHKGRDALLIVNSRPSIGGFRRKDRRYSDANKTLPRSGACDVTVMPC